MACHHIYTDQLRSLNIGHALWEPSPNDPSQQVEVGDVGYVLYGGFHRLFNIHLPAGHPRQGRKLPEYFETLELDPDHVYRRVLHPAPYRSQSVVSLNVEAPFAVATPGGQVSLEFSCSRQRGAVLVLSDKANRTDTRSRGAYKTYLRTHCDRWFALTEDLGLSLRQEDIILVTGCDKTTSWATAAFVNREIQGRISLQVGFAGIGVGSATLASRLRWTQNNNAQYNWGPEVDDAVPQVEPARMIGSDVLTATSEGLSDAQRPINTKYNQCVFVRGYRGKSRGRFLPMKIKAAATPIPGPSRLGDNNDADGHGLTSSPVLVDLSDDGMEGSHLQNVENQTGPDDEHTDMVLPILDYILENSDVDFAIVHDDDLKPYVEDATCASDITTLLKENSPLVVKAADNLTYGCIERLDKDKDPVEPKERGRSSSRRRNHLERDKIQYYPPRSRTRSASHVSLTSSRSEDERFASRRSSRSPSRRRSRSPSHESFRSPSRHSACGISSMTPAAALAHGHQPLPIIIQPHAIIPPSRRSSRSSSRSSVNRQSDRYSPIIISQNPGYMSHRVASPPISPYSRSRSPSVIYTSRFLPSYDDVMDMTDAELRAWVGFSHRDMTRATKSTRVPFSPDLQREFYAPIADEFMRGHMESLSRILYTRGVAEEKLLPRAMMIHMMMKDETDISMKRQLVYLESLVDAFETAKQSGQLLVLPDFAAKMLEAKVEVSAEELEKEKSYPATLLKLALQSSFEAPAITSGPISSIAGTMFPLLPTPTKNPTSISALAFTVSFVDLFSAGIHVSVTYSLDEHLKATGNTVKVFHLSPAVVSALRSYRGNRLAIALGIEGLGDEILASWKALLEGYRSINLPERVDFFTNDLEIEMDRVRQLENMIKFSRMITPSIFAARERHLKALIQSRREWHNVVKNDLDHIRRNNPQLFYGALVGIIALQLIFFQLMLFMRSIVAVLSAQ